MQTNITPNTRQPTVFIVVLNWNGLSDTLECLDGLQALEYPNKRVVVVDNGSDGPEAERIEAAAPSVTVIRNTINLGYAGGNNCGIRHALIEGADYIWLLNNDTTAAPNSLRELVAAGERRRDVGLLSPVVYQHGTDYVIQFTGTLVDCRHEELLTLTTIQDMEVASKTGPILLWGTALLLKRSVVETVGFLDERYFAYHEDADYCLRVVRAGLGTLVVPTAKVYHKSGRSLGPGESPIREYLLVRNWYLLWRNHLTGWQRTTYPRRYLAWVLYRVLNSRRAGNDVVADHALDGAWDAWRGRWGSWATKGQVPRCVRQFFLRYLLAWHPYFWIMLIGGKLGPVLSRAFRRVVRRTTS